MKSKNIIYKTYIATQVFIKRNIHTYIWIEETNKMD